MPNKITILCLWSSVILPGSVKTQTRLAFHVSADSSSRPTPFVAASYHIRSTYISQQSCFQSFQERALILWFLDALLNLDLADTSLIFQDSKRFQVKFWSKWW